MTTDKQKEWYQANRERIISKSVKWQKENHTRYVARLKKWRVKNMARELKRSRKWKSENKERHLESSRRYSREHATEISEKRKAQRRILKQKVINGYGGKCECCNESILEFLTLDHINDDGAEHRRKLRSRQSRRLYDDIIWRNFPSGFRVLCFNCNSARGFYGYCPHKPGEKKSPNRGIKSKAR